MIQILTLVGKYMYVLYHFKTKGGVGICTNALACTIWKMTKMLWIFFFISKLVRIQ